MCVLLDAQHFPKRSYTRRLTKEGSYQYLLIFRLRRIFPVHQINSQYKSLNVPY